MTLLSDELLLAYLDGQLDKTQAVGITRLAGENAEISRRLTRLKRTQTQLLETFGALAQNERPLPNSILAFEGAERGNGGPASKPGKSRAAGRLLLVLAIFGGGLLGGYGAKMFIAQRAPQQPKSEDRISAGPALPSGWAADLARFHAFFPRETLTPHPDAITSPDLIRFQLTKVAGRAIVPPDFSRQGYTLLRGQMFNFNQERMMQLVYASKTEPPLTLYVLPASGLGDNPPEVSALGSAKAASWVSDRVRFFLSGEKSDDDLKVLAAIIQGQMPRRN